MWRRIESEICHRGTHLEAKYLRTHIHRTNAMNKIKLLFPTKSATNSPPPDVHARAKVWISAEEGHCHDDADIATTALNQVPLPESALQDPVVYINSNTMDSCRGKGGIAAATLSTRFLFPNPCPLQDTAVYTNTKTIGFLQRKVSISRRRFIRFRFPNLRCNRPDSAVNQHQRRQVATNVFKLPLQCSIQCS